MLTRSTLLLGALGLAGASACTAEVLVFGNEGSTSTASSGSGSTAVATGSGGGLSTTSVASVTSTASGAGGAGGFGGMGQGGEPVPPCHPPGLVDTFDGNTVDLTRWNRQGNVGNISVYGGQLHMKPKEGVAQDQWSGMVTKDEYDLTQCAVWIMVPSLVKNGAEGLTYFQLYNNSGQAAFTVKGGQLELKIGSQVTTVPYSMSNHLWWRIRDDNGTLLLETSPNASAWTIVHSASTPPWIDDVVVGLGTTSEANATQVGETKWDNLNALP